MKNKELWRSLMAKLLAACAVLQMTMSAMAEPNWEPKPDLDASGVPFWYNRFYPSAAKDGLLYEFAEGANGNPGSGLYRWSDMQGWQLIVSFTSANSVQDPIVAAMMIKGNLLYFGGYFDGLTTSSGQTLAVHNIAALDLTSLTPFQVGDGSLSTKDDAVVAITVDNKNNVFAGLNVYNQEFSQNGNRFKPDSLQIVTCCGTSAWSQLGKGLNCDSVQYMSYVVYDYIIGGGVETLATDGTNVFAGGRFLGGTNSDNSYVPSGGLIKWDGTSWHTMGNTAVVQGKTQGGIFNPLYADVAYFVSSVAVSGTNVFVTGNFCGFAPDGSPVLSSVGQGLARFAIAGTLLEANILDYNNTLYTVTIAGGWGWSLAVQPDQTVYLAGGFDKIDAATGFQCIAQWKAGQGWSKLDAVNGDANGRVLSLAADANAVYAHGTFDAVAGIPLTPEDNDGAPYGHWATWGNGPTISTIVGNHSLGGTYSGDGGPAISAGLACPVGISFYNGRLGIADFGNGTVRYVDDSGIIYSPWGGQYQNFSSPLGVVLDGTGYMYSADGDYGGVREFQGGNTIYLNSTPAISVSSDSTRTSLYAIGEFGDGGNTVSKMHCVIPYYGSPDGIVTRVAGTGTEGYSGDNGPATAATLNLDTWLFLPNGFIVPSTTVDQQGNVYIADMGNNVIRKVDTSGNISTVAGNYYLGAGYSGNGQSAVNAQLCRPSAVAVDPLGNLYIADAGNNVIRRVDQNGVIRTVAGTGQAGYSGDGGAALNATLRTPGGLAFDASGNLYISDTGNDVIRKVTFH